MSNPKIGVFVNYRTQVLNADGSAARPWSNWKRNLVLDVGLDMPAVSQWGHLTDFIAVGSGTTPVKRDSGTTQFSRSGNVVTADNAFFVAADAASGGRLLKFDSGEVMRITGYTDATHVTVGTSGTLAASQGTVWYANETGHATEFARFGSLSTGAGECQSTFVAGTWTFRRTYLSGTFGAPNVVREIGWSPNGSGSLYGRDLVPGGGDSVAAGQIYKVQVESNLAIGPAVSAAVADVGNNGFNTSGTAGAEYAGSAHIALTNETGFVSGGGFWEPSMGVSSVAGALGTSATAIGALQNANGDFSTFSAFASISSWTKDAYSSGDHAVRYRGFLDVNSGNSEAIRSIMIGNNGRPAFRVLTATAQTKDNLHEFRPVFKLSWDRVLVN